ncbi:adenosylmethionine--8-amino-7-oxononanoate transaminase [Candidatus Nitrosocosmicus sp. SS]|uniref:adenosylmethionine--8-amino-7-oxononanoate transaminase n=1 Tax=Candidatus Nitrosocosmicus agrestis TaxID=2563600 RepID=UPI00122E0691|nr:adenosylmethionine--8-amino-7-oxononanoate transaminase [Candidatus Nitrosocosmicus sp. SS]KAA2282672.1 adenosylmethionine--8-amino-7-oxononanoate transaminase [Candidatus Nitrosocosmicus sp. SS]KAF0867929.1 adenosylmethionine--8-amino-7-oxononanoate transaminase [Candidatus Nitrosocosmicus sp. SS]
MSKDDKTWYPYSQMSETFKHYKIKTISSGSDFYFVDRKGHRYLDGVSNMWCNVWGFSENRIINAMRDQVLKIPHSNIFGIANDKSQSLSSKFLQLTEGMDKLFYTDNGSSAIEVAMKIATQYWYNKDVKNKSIFLSLKDGYHGDTIGAMSVGYVENYFNRYKQLLIPTRRIPKPKSTLIERDNQSDLKLTIEKSKNIIEKNADKAIALIMESGAQIAGGVTIFPDGYQKQIKDICRKNNVLLILDEIATGFGRLGNMVEYLAQESTPDIACFGKSITGGYFPLALTAASKNIYQEFEGKWDEGRQLYHGHTYSGHPVGCAAVLENIKMYKEKKLIERIRTNASKINKRIREFDKFPIVENIRSKGMLSAFDLIHKKKMIKNVNGVPITIFIIREALKRGVFLRPLGSTMLIIPPLAIDFNSIEKIIDVQTDIINDIQKSLN